MEGTAENQRKTTQIYAAIAREYLKYKRVYRYRMKKISDMDDEQAIRACHDWYEENRLEREYRAFEAEKLGISSKFGLYKTR